jgi:hypothetical protein
MALSGSVQVTPGLFSLGSNRVPHCTDVGLQGSACGERRTTWLDGRWEASRVSELVRTRVYGTLVMSWPQGPLLQVV